MDDPSEGNQAKKPKLETNGDNENVTSNMNTDPDTTTPTANTIAHPANNNTNTNNNAASLPAENSEMELSESNSLSNPVSPKPQQMPESQISNSSNLSNPSDSLSLSAAAAVAANATSPPTGGKGAANASSSSLSSSSSSNNSIKKWQTLSHNGFLFPPPYEPHGKPLIYDGQTINLPSGAEEIATLMTSHLLGKCVTDFDDPIFKENIMHDLIKELSISMPDHPVKEFEKCDFSLIKAHIEEKRKRKRKQPEDRKLEEATEKENDAKYGIAIVDGQRRKADYKIETPCIYRTKDVLRGKFLRRVVPEDVTVNIGFSEKVPTPPEGHNWKEVVHEQGSLWIGRWFDSSRRRFKYVQIRKEEGLRSGQKEIDKGTEKENNDELDQDDENEHEGSPSSPSLPQQRTQHQKPPHPHIQIPRQPQKEPRQQSPLNHNQFQQLQKELSQSHQQLRQQLEQLQQLNNQGDLMETKAISDQLENLIKKTSPPPQPATPPITPTITITQAQQKTPQPSTTPPQKPSVAQTSNSQPKKSPQQRQQQQPQAPQTRSKNSPTQPQKQSPLPQQPPQQSQKQNTQSGSTQQPQRQSQQQNTQTLKQSPFPQQPSVKTTTNGPPNSSAQQQSPAVHNQTLTLSANQSTQNQALPTELELYGYLAKLQEEIKRLKALELHHAALEQENSQLKHRVKILEEDMRQFLPSTPRGMYFHYRTESHLAKVPMQIEHFEKVVREVFRLQNIGGNNSKIVFKFQRGHVLTSFDDPSILPEDVKDIYVSLG